MCTVTWWRDSGAGSFGVWFNRDERRTRPASEPVRRQTAGPEDTPFLAPRDPAAGGTWLLANAHGLVVGVLNFYAAERDGVGTDAGGATPPRSRGTLPLHHAAARSVAEVQHVMESLSCGDYAPFLLLAWDTSGEARWSWDGVRISCEPSPAPPVTTSSFRSQEICAWRCARYAEMVARPTAATLSTYQDDAVHAESAFNVRMRRPDAQTESVCRVTVTPREVHFWHRRESPDALTALDETELRIDRA